jgi:hypothetical protein
MIVTLLAASLCAGPLAAPARAAAPPLARVGDPGSVPDPSKFDDRIPEMKEWAVAGVEGGIPSITRIIKVLDPANNLPEEINKADCAENSKGAFLLKPGTFECGTTPIKMKPGLVLRGADREKTILSTSMAEGGHAGFINMATGSALEDLTVWNTLVKAKKESEYQGVYKNLGAPGTTLVNMGSAKNAWLQRCNIFYAGSHPIDVGGSGHCTFRDNFISKAYNKGGQGNGYLHFGGAHHLLFFNERIEDLRHVSIMWKANCNVFYKCRLNVDINFHDGLPHANLVEACTVQRRGGHHWGAICFGWPPWQKVGPGPRNFLWNNQFDDAGGGDKNLWILRDTTPGYAAMQVKEPMLMDFGPPPKHGTLYAVTGLPITLEEVDVRAAMAEMEKARASKHWNGAAKHARKVTLMTAPGSERRTQAEAVLAQADEAAAKRWAEIQNQPNEQALRRYLADWGEAPSAAKAREACNELGVQKLKGLKDPAGKIATPSLRGFLKEWDGFPVHAQALEIYHEAARQEFAKIKTTDPEQRLRELKYFLKQWEPSPPPNAVAEYQEGLKKSFEEIRADANDAARFRKLARLAQTHGESEYGQEAKRMAEEMLKKAQPGAR